MKARTKAAKREVKRGRPRLPATEREPNGQPSRRVASVKKREGKVKAVAMEARARIYHISEKQADTEYAGYVLGRLFLAKLVTHNQLSAGNRLAEDFGRYYRLTGIPFPSARAQDMFAVRGEAGPCNAEGARNASNRVMALEGVLGRIDESGRPVTSMVKRVCIMDDESAIHHGHMLTFLRRGLDALVQHYMIGVDEGGKSP